MLYSGTDPESYITEYTLVYEEKSESSQGSRRHWPSVSMGLWLRVEGLGLGFEGLVFRVKCVGFGIWGLRFWMQGLGFRA